MIKTSNFAIIKEVCILNTNTILHEGIFTVKQKLSRYIEKRWIRNLIFFFISLILFLPFLINGELITYVDSNFHITRLYEIVKLQQHGQFFPDIVKYSGVQNWGYGLNLFYPSYGLLPLTLLWRLLNNPVLAFILFDIFIVYFALIMNYSVFKKATNNILQAFIFSITYILTASAGIGTNPLLTRLVWINQYTSNIVFLFAPVVLISFYQIIFKSDKRFWKSAAGFSALAVMLSIPETFALVLTILSIFIVGLLKKKINIKNINILFGTTIATIALSAIFTIPFLEQRLGSNWAPLPNSQTQWGKSFFDNVVKNIFNFSDILSLLVIVIFALLFINKKLNKNYKYIALGYLISLLFLHSSVFPWWLIQNFFSETIQYTSRLDFIPKLLGSVFVAMGLIDLTEEKPRIIPITSSIMLIFAILGMYGNTIFTYFPVLPASQVGPTKAKDGIKNESFEPTNKNLRWRLYFRVNPQNIDVILNSNFATRKELGQKNNDLTYSSLAFNDYRIEGQFKNNQKVYANSLVKFDGKLHENMTSVQGEDLIINNLPTNIDTVQAPITYLKGFKASDSKGNKLVSYKNSDGFLEIEPNGSDVVKVTYQKTIAHKVSIIISIFSWIIFLVGISISKIMKGKNHAKTINNRSRVQRRRSARNVRR